MTTGIHKIDFSSPDEVRAPEKTTMEIVNVGSTKVARLTAQPGAGSGRSVLPRWLAPTAARLTIWEWSNRASYWCNTKTVAKPH